jgi:uncharacterized membrane protein
MAAESTDRDRYALDRLIFFSDGVFAIAITLLALDLRLPPIAERSSSALAAALAANVPRFITFFISFQVIGVFWMAHHRLYAVIARFDRGLAMLNLLFLMSIVVMPFSTSLLIEYGDLTAAAAFYSGSLVVTSVTSNLIWLYAARGRRLLDPHTARAEIRVITGRGLVTLAFFVVSLGVAFVSVRLAQATWVSVAVVTPLIERWARRQHVRH